jgi:hypothetical protein
MVLGFAWTAVLPAVMDILKKGAERIITGRRMTVDDEIRLMQAETEKLKALAELDRSETNISPVIANFRASFRYVFCLLIFLGTLLCIFGDVRQEFTGAMLDLLSGVVFFLIGHRTYLYLQKR